MMEIDILYEDHQLMVCRKPAGVPVQSAKIGAKDMVSVLRNYRKEKENNPYIALGAPSRSAGTGCDVFAKTKEAAGTFKPPDDRWENEEAVSRRSLWKT